MTGDFKSSFISHFSRDMFQLTCDSKVRLTMTSPNVHENLHYVKIMYIIETVSRNPL